MPMMQKLVVIVLVTLLFACSCCLGQRDYERLIMMAADESQVLQDDDYDDDVVRAYMEDTLIEFIKETFDDFFDVFCDKCGEICDNEEKQEEEECTTCASLCYSFDTMDDNDTLEDLVLYIFNRVETFREIVLERFIDHVFDGQGKDKLFNKFAEAVREDISDAHDGDDLMRQYLAGLLNDDHGNDNYDYYATIQVVEEESLFEYVVSSWLLPAGLVFGILAMFRNLAPKRKKKQRPRMAPLKRPLTQEDKKQELTKHQIEREASKAKARREPQKAEPSGTKKSRSARKKEAAKRKEASKKTSSSKKNRQRQQHQQEEEVQGEKADTMDSEALLVETNRSESPVETREDVVLTPKEAESHVAITPEPPIASQKTTTTSLEPNQKPTDSPEVACSDPPALKWSEVVKQSTTTKARPVTPPPAPSSSEELLVFLEDHQDDIKGSPEAFVQWLAQDDICCLQDLADAVSDDDYHAALQQGDGTVGIKGFRRKSFKKDVLAVVNQNVTEQKPNRANDDFATNDDDVPSELLCPISHTIMVNDPVVAADGHTYERVAISAWIRKQQAELDAARGNEDSPQARAILERGVLSPMTHTKMPHLNLTENRSIRIMSRDFVNDSW